MDFALRPVTEADRDWLFALQREAYGTHVAQTWGAWDDAAQRARFDAAFAPANLRIITVLGRDAGLLHVERSPHGIFLTNIELAAEFRGRGLGTALIGSLLEEARSRGVPLSLQVLKVNLAACRLYERHGFTVFEETATHFRMVALSA